MCGRYGLFHDASEIAEAFGADIARLDPPPAPRYNVAPTQNAPILVPRDGEGRVALMARWGLIPHWAKDPATFRATLVNARSESAHEKPSFREAFKRDRCVVPASGFYEWRAPEGGGRKQPFWIRRRDGAPLALAGLHARNERAEIPHSFTILTTRPNALMARLHDRQPVILPAAAIDAWFDPERRDAASLSDLLEPNDPAELEALPIGTAVNRPGNEGPELLEPQGEPLRV
jgi:putative SOS response-associated peptidase YedK